MCPGLVVGPELVVEPGLVVGPELVEEPVLVAGADLVGGGGGGGGGQCWLCAQSCGDPYKTASTMLSSVVFNKISAHSNVNVVRLQRRMCSHFNNNFLGVGHI